ncbi:hypothetical protein Q1695_004662 [Nippostrongylus brasiliensis]|nr:hypothetical protein Q1695_004662 [Nippostrongylus brasiliensis]
MDNCVARCGIVSFVTHDGAVPLISACAAVQLAFRMSIILCLVVWFVCTTGTKALQCYLTQHQTYKDKLSCALSVDFRGYSECEILDYKLWGPANQSTVFPSGTCIDREQDYVGEYYPARRVICMCDSDTFCVLRLSTFQEHLQYKINLQNEESYYYSCLQNSLQQEFFGSPPTTTEPDVGSATQAEEEQQFTLTDEEKEYLDWAIARNIFIMILLMVVICVSGYFSVLNDLF